MLPDAAQMAELATAVLAPEIAAGDNDTLRQLETILEHSGLLESFATCPCCQPLGALSIDHPACLHPCLQCLAERQAFVGIGCQPANGGDPLLCGVGDSQHG